MISCSQGKNKISIVGVAEEMPMIHTEEITALISDSGITRYRLTTQIWDMFQNDSNSYWHFPQGVYVEQFDTLLNIQGTLKADTAYNYETKSLWHAIGNVYIKNVEGVTFETSELFWDEKPVLPSYALYTDKFVKVTTAEGRIITGIGMHSDIEMKDYVFYQTGAEFDSYETSLRDTTSTDSIVAPLDIIPTLNDSINNE